MRVLALSGSQLKKGNTSQLIESLLERMEKSDIKDLKVKSVSLSGIEIKPCKACRKCMKTGRCVVKDDFTSIARKMLKSDLIVLGSPVYFHDVSGTIKNLIDRSYSLWHDHQLKGKKFVPVAVSASIGEDRTLETLRIWAQAHEMKIIHSVSGHGDKRGDILHDEQAKIAIETTIKELVGEFQVKN